MEMGAYDRIDRLAGVSGGGHVGEETCLHPVPGRDAAVLLVVAETGVDNDAPVWRLDDERTDTHPQPAAVIGEIRPQPVDRQDLLIGRLGQQKAAAAGHFELDDLGHSDRADPPFHHRLSLSVDRLFRNAAHPPASFARPNPGHNHFPTPPEINISFLAGRVQASHRVECFMML
jgi:hypothetical protein